MAAMEESVHPFVDRYVRDNGEFIWDDAWGGGSPDDYYEPYFNWPLLYLMGGGSHLVELAHRGWEGSDAAADPAAARFTTSTTRPRTSSTCPRATPSSTTSASPTRPTAACA